VPVEHRVNRADRRALDLGIEPPQLLPDLRRAPVELVLLQLDDLLLDLERELIGVAIRPATAVCQA